MYDLEGHSRSLKLALFGIHLLSVVCSSDVALSHSFGGVTKDDIAPEAPPALYHLWCYHIYNVYYRM